MVDTLVVRLKIVAFLVLLVGFWIPLIFGSGGAEGVAMATVGSIGCLLTFNQDDDTPSLMWLAHILRMFVTWARSWRGSGMPTATFGK